MSDDCQHKYIFGGVVFKNTNENLPGSGATIIRYYDWFFCERCLKNMYAELSETTNSYSKILFGAAPMAKE